MLTYKFLICWLILEVTITVEGLQNLSLCAALRPLEVSNWEDEYICFPIIFLYSFHQRNRKQKQKYCEKMDLHVCQNHENFPLFTNIYDFDYHFYKDTYRNKDILIIEQSGHLFPFEIIDHSETSRVQVIFYVVRHERGRVQIPIHDIGGFGQKGHLARQNDTKSTSMSTIKQLNIIHLLTGVKGNIIHLMTGFDGNLLFFRPENLTVS